MSRSRRLRRLVSVAAVLASIAAGVLIGWSLRAGSGALSIEKNGSQAVAVELLIARADLARLQNGANLPAQHIFGLRQRIQGSLGVLGWLLTQDNDPAGADIVRGWAASELQNPGRLAGDLDRLIERHPLDLTRYATQGLTVTQRREAVAIQAQYCAGCHDNAGNGDPDTNLPARDLYAMARTEPPETFLARLISGVKGDETLLFTNPLTADQIAAMWQVYRTGAKK